jgi:hypothetical protein
VPLRWRPGARGRSPRARAHGGILRGLPRRVSRARRAARPKFAIRRGAALGSPRRLRLSAGGRCGDGSQFRRGRWRSPVPAFGDPRPWILGGSAFLVTSQPAPAIENYREALSTGERAEIDLNLGRAFAMLQRAEDARAALLRAGWVSPEILASLPPAAKDPILNEIERLSWQLRRGKLDAPPRLP